MDEALLIVTVGVVAFMATSLDNLLLLVALLGRPGQPRAPLFAGTLAASAVVVE